MGGLESNMYHYTAYNLKIHSVVPLPELAPDSASSADVVIQWGSVERTTAERDLGSYRFHSTLGEVYFVWEQLGAFLVRNGEEIIVEPLAGDQPHLRLPILGMALALVLHQRGFLVLHASAIAIKESGIAFLGRRGRGKSTLAATLYARGHNLIADDLVALDLSSPHPRIMPGIPQLKLWPEAAVASLGDDPAHLPRLVSGYEKRARCAATQFAQQSLPLSGLYLLAENQVPQLTLLRPQEAIVQLIDNSYIARVAQPLLQGEAAALHLRQCGSLIQQVPVYRLDRPRLLPLLPAVARLVEAQAAQDSSCTKV
ncbi:MAG TPA: hypothetical protein V6D03_04700 [Candidatus Caenarcaniphilales bacterium]